MEKPNEIQDENFRRKTVRGIHFLKLKGTEVERARAHGRLLKQEILDGALPILAKKNESLIRKGPGLVQKQIVQDTIVWFYKKVLVPTLDRGSSMDDRSLVLAVSEATGLTYEQCRESLFQPDGLMLLSRISIMKHLLRQLPGGGLPGCTSAVTMKSWNASGRLMACRNQDYPVVGPWEKATTVMFHEPTESDQIPYVGITTAGVHTGGLTSVNREGITLFAHAHFGRSVRLTGTPVISLGNQIIRQAKTLGEAVDIARKNPRYANWAFVVSSAKENDALIIEMTPTKTRVSPAQDGFLAHSNFFHTPELQREEALMSGACCEDLVARLCRMREVLEPHRGQIEPRHMTAALGDHIDRQTGEERVFGNTVSVMTTVKSTVFDAEGGKLWISARGESPMGLGPFLEVDLEKFWTQDKSEAEYVTLPGYQPRNPALVEGVRHYRDAYRAMHMEGHLPDSGERTLAALRRAVRAFPSDGNLWVQNGIIAFENAKFDEARRCLAEASSRKLTPHVSGVRDLFFARCLDIEGERERAVELYRGWERVHEPKLRKALKRGVNKPYHRSEVRNLMTDLQFPDAFQY